MKYVDVKVVFREVPDEVTLAINISGCPVGCPGCHSAYLKRDIGEELNEESLEELMRINSGVSCVSFMGGDADPAYIAQLSRYVKKIVPQMKTCWYSGRGLEEAREVINTLDYLKVGPYDDRYGPLDSKTTNQRFYRICRGDGEIELEDITARFRKTYF
ncbi:MAG: anaerobic ribonucleoside-triphosphate reductase activating protein [Bacteroidales bacterium]|nr:anaerobic ribonucleoside-triphosphate reductase activating protein [Bacteroidales bacterium]